MTAGRRAARPLRHTLLAGALSLCALGALAPSAAHAAQPPFGEARVALTAREQPIGEFLKELYSQAGLTVVLSPDLAGRVNGVFNGPAERVYGGVARAFGLLTYYDGVAVYVYPASQIASRAVEAPTSDAPRIQAAVRQLGLADAQNQVRVSNNMLVATGSKRFLDQVDELARTNVTAASADGGSGRAYVATAVAAPAPPPLQYRVYYLRYAWAEDVTLSFSGRQVTLPGVASILRSLTGGGPTAQRTEAGFGGGGGGALQGLKGQGLNPNANRDLGTLGFNLAAFGNMPQANNDAAWQQVANASAGGAAQGAAQGAGLSAFGLGADGARVVADNRLNAVIIRDTREKLAAYDQLIRALDVEPQLVEIDATVIDIDTDKVKDLGASLSLINLSSGNAFALGVGQGGGFQQGIGQGGGGIFAASVGAGDTRLNIGIEALVEKGYAKVVSRPQVLTLSDVEAVFDNTRTFYVRVPGYAASDLYNINAGTTLRVTPHVTRDNGETRIRMLVAVQDGTVTGQSVDRIPVVQNSGINTQALLVEGQGLLLGGMVTQREEQVKDKVPLLGDIPVAGFFFRSSHREAEHRERLFLITPHLISTGAPNALPTGSQAPPALAPQAAPTMTPAAPPPPPSTPPTATTGPVKP